MKINKIRISYSNKSADLVPNFLWNEISEEVHSLPSMLDYVSVFFYNARIAKSGYKYTSNFSMFIKNGKVLKGVYHLSEFNI